MEVRKHVQQMTYDEKQMLNRLVKQGRYKPTNYCMRKMEKRNVSFYHMRKALKDGDLIEFHYKDNSFRALIRGKVDRTGVCVCVVVDVKTKEFVTVYLNDGNDNHDTLNKELYIGSCNIIELFKQSYFSKSCQHLIDIG